MFVTTIARSIYHASKAIKSFRSGARRRDQLLRFSELAAAINFYVSQAIGSSFPDPSPSGDLTLNQRRNTTKFQPKQKCTALCFPIHRHPSSCSPQRHRRSLPSIPIAASAVVLLRLFPCRRCVRSLRARPRRELGRRSRPARDACQLAANAAARLVLPLRTTLLQLLSSAAQLAVTASLRPSPAWRRRRCPLLAAASSISPSPQLTGASPPPSHEQSPATTTGHRFRQRTRELAGEEKAGFEVVYLRPLGDILGAMKWDIIHIHNEPDSSLEVPTVEVLASNIEPKSANSIVRQLNQVCPLDNLRHVKRVQRRTSKGKVELSVILCLADEHEKDTEAIPIGIQPLIRAYNLCPIRTKVAKHAARSKEEWEEQCKIWPTSFHPSTNYDGVATLSEEDLEMIFHYMKVAIQQTKLYYSGAKVLNAAVIVDPSSRKVIASANDQTHPSLTTSEPSTTYGCTDGCGATTVPHESLPNTAGSNQNTTVQKFSLSKCSDILAGVPCLNPWGWTAQELVKQNSLVKRENKFTWHPLRHAALVAIENAAERDRKLFPNSEVLESKSEAFNVLLHTADKCPSKRQKIEEQIVNEEVSDDLKPTEIIQPYLCTGFDIYLVWEPCPMCAMALVHQRIRRIFYALPNPNIGALGSVYKLQGEKSLNHHYSVFRVSVPEQDLEELILNTADNTSQC